MVEKDSKRRIIALTGRLGVPLDKIQRSLTRLTNVFKVVRVTADQDLSTNEFLNKLIRGDIIEADGDQFIKGTDKTTIEPGFLYVGIYTPYQISNLLECKDKNIEILPIEIELDDKERFDNICAFYENVAETCEDYLKDQKNYDADEYFDGEAVMWLHYSSTQELLKETADGNLYKRIKKFNENEDIITNLDNFI